MSEEAGFCGPESACDNLQEEVEEKEREIQRLEKKLIVAAEYRAKIEAERDRLDRVIHQQAGKIIELAEENHRLRDDAKQ